MANKTNLLFSFSFNAADQAVRMDPTNLQDVLNDFLEDITPTEFDWISICQGESDGAYVANINNTSSTPTPPGIGDYIRWQVECISADADAYTNLSTLESNVNTFASGLDNSTTNIRYLSGEWSYKLCAYVLYLKDFTP